MVTPERDNHTDMRESAALDFSSVPSAQRLAVREQLTEIVRNDELDEWRRKQPYRLIVDPSGEMRQVPFHTQRGSEHLHFEVHANVFPPDFGITTSLITRTAIEQFPHCQHLLEMGAGSGYPGISVAAASTHLQQLTLVDILPEAVACAGRNVDLNRHRFPEKCDIDVLQSDLFTAVHPLVRADLILHNQTFYPDNGRFGLNPDGGKQITERFLRQARSHLDAGGWILMNFASFVEAVHDPLPIARALGYQTEVLSTKATRDGQTTAYVYGFH